MLKNSTPHKLLVLICTLIVILIFLEIICKNVEQTYFFNTSVYVQQAKPLLHKISDIPGLSYELIANTKVEDGMYSINSKGIRDREFIIPKPDDVFRIIVLGDSVTFGTEYPIDLTYPKILEQLLNKKLNLKCRYEVLNAGVCAYNALQKFLFFKHNLADYDPDMVIFQFLNDDYYRNAVLLPGHQSSNNNDVFLSLGEYFNANFPKLLFIPYLADRFLIRHSSLYRVLNKSLYDCLSFNNPGRFPKQAYRFAATSNMEESMRLNKAVFEELYKLSNDQNFKVEILLVPELTEESLIDGWIKNECSNKYGFGNIDLQKEFKLRGVELKQLRIVPEGRCHLNEIGHRITAEIIEQYLSKSFSD